MYSVHRTAEHTRLGRWECLVSVLDLNEPEAIANMHSVIFVMMASSLLQRFVVSLNDHFCLLFSMFDVDVVDEN